MMYKRDIIHNIDKRHIRDQTTRKRGCERQERQEKKETGETVPAV